MSLIRGKSKKKGILALLLLIACLAVFSPYPHFPRTLTNAETGAEAQDAKINIPLASQLLSPFLDFPFYFLTFPYPKPQILSWLFWLSALWVILTGIRLKCHPFKKTLILMRGIIAATMFFTLLIIYCIFFPLPQYRLETSKPGEILLDLHSHTFYSHDGLITPEKSLEWHLGSGFDAWAITEHDHIGPASQIQNATMEKRNLNALSIPGMEIGFEGVHLNLIGIEEPIDKKEYPDLKALIGKVHDLGGAVIVPHFWAARRPGFSPDELSAAGVDAFEIAGNASIPATRKAQEQIIAACRRGGVVMVSGTNWHGWRNFCNVWTGLVSEEWENMDSDLRQKEVISALRNRETDRFRVIQYNPPPRGHYIIEPFSGLFFYFRSINNLQRLSWLFWIAVIIFLWRRVKNKKKTAVFLWSAAALALVIKGVHLHLLWQAVSQLNKVLPDIIKSFFIAVALILMLAITAGKIKR